ncbi:MAG: acyl-CoA dehydrogenase [Cyclobacteriaceae bacterium]
MKKYSSEQVSGSASLALQTLGGYGFTMDFPVQQHYRDLKIMSLYEGTTGIQSIDLLGRKVVMEKGKALAILGEQIQAAIQSASQLSALKKNAKQLETEWTRIQQVLAQLSTFAPTSIDRYLADATVFMEQLSYVVIAWQWLKQAIVAQRNIDAGNFKNQSQSFYEGKVVTMKFFFRYELTHAAACAQTLLDEEFLTNVKKKELFD